MPAEFTTVTLEAEHVPETHRSLESDHTVSEQELPGTVNVYLVIDGARLLFTQYKAGKVFDAIEQARQTQGEQAQQTPSEPSQPSQPSGEPPAQPQG